MTDILTMPGGPPAYHILAKPTGPICNLDCEYCFFLSKEMLYPGDRFRMADELLETYIQQLLESHRTPEVMVAWQGGEPTMMGLDFFRRSVELVEKHRKPNQQISYSIQTNGTMLDDAWAVFFKENSFLVGLSVDGPKDLHDAYRVDKRGLGSFDRVMEGWEILNARDVDFNVLCTIHAKNADHPLEVYKFFRDDMNVQFVQFIPVVERATETILPLANLGWGLERGDERPLYLQEGSRVTDRSVTAEQFGAFLSTIFDEWVSHDVGEVYVQHFDVALANWHGEPSGLCVFSETCGLALALEHNASLVTLTMNVDGVPQDVETRLEIAMNIVATALEYGMDPRKVFIDPIILPVTCDQKQPRFILEVISQIKMLSDPAPGSIVGLSNVSQGAAERPLINRSFLVMALAAGLDAAIVDVLDEPLMDAAIAAEMILDKSIYSASFLKAARM